MKKQFLLCLAVGLLSAAAAMNSFGAVGWQQDAEGKWFYVSEEQEEDREILEEDLIACIDEIPRGSSEVVAQEQALENQQDKAHKLSIKADENYVPETSGVGAPLTVGQEQASEKNSTSPDHSLNITKTPKRTSTAAGDHQKTDSAEAAAVETYPAEAAPAETYPSETSPAETYPAETAPAETYPAEKEESRRREEQQKRNTFTPNKTNTSTYLDQISFEVSFEGDAPTADNMSIRSLSQHITFKDVQINNERKMLALTFSADAGYYFQIRKASAIKMNRYKDAARLKYWSSFRQNETTEFMVILSWGQEVLPLEALWITDGNGVRYLNPVTGAPLFPGTSLEDNYGNRMWFDGNGYIYKIYPGDGWLLLGYSSWCYFEDDGNLARNKVTKDGFPVDARGIFTGDPAQLKYFLMTQF